MRSVPCTMTVRLAPVSRAGRPSRTPVKPNTNSRSTAACGFAVKAQANARRCALRLALQRVPAVGPVDVRFDRARDVRAQISVARLQTARRPRLSVGAPACRHGRCRHRRERRRGDGQRAERGNLRQPHQNRYHPRMLPRDIAGAAAASLTARVRAEVRAAESHGGRHRDAERQSSCSRTFWSSSKFRTRTIARCR